jgi:hypothetical protein
MKKNSFMVKNMFMSMLTAGIFATAFTACHDDDFDPKGFNNGPKAESFELTNLEQYSYTVPVQVNVEGDWEIEFKFNNEYNHFCYALPNKGHGPQTIKLCMLDNWTESRNEGQMIIHDLSNNKNDQSFRLMQKCNLDNAEVTRARTRTRAEGGEAASEGEEKKEESSTSIIYSEGLRKFAIGYGYNCSMAPGFSAVSTNPILALEKIAEQKNDAGAHVCEEGNISSSSYTGSSYRELYTKLTTEVTGKANKGSLTAEMKSTFTVEQKQSQKHTFVYTTANFKTHSAYISGVDPSNVKQFLTDNAKNAINGLSPEYDNSKEGFANLVNYYGSHLILQAELGGRMSYASTVENSLTSNVNEATAFAKCTYKSKVAEATGSVDANIKSKYEKNSQLVKTSVDTKGGEINLSLSESTFNDWLKSVKDKPIVTNFVEGKASLIPLYDLVDTSLPGGPARKQAMKDYFETGMLNVMAYDGTDGAIDDAVYKIALPKEFISNCGEFQASEEKGTLVYDAWYRGKRIAMICKEYIPLLSNQGLVVTVYPVKDDKPNLNNGRFLGTDIKPASVISWALGERPALSLTSTIFGQETQVYVRGDQVFTSAPQGARVIDVDIKGNYLKFRKCKSDVNVILGERGTGAVYKDEDAPLKLKFEEDHQYPLVKIGKHIWLREEFSGYIPNGSDKFDRFGTKVVDGKVYYTRYATFLTDTRKPVGGWHVATTAEFENLKANVTYDMGSKTVGELMQKGGNTGFDMPWNGWYTYDHSSASGIAWDGGPEWRTAHFYSNYSAKGGKNQMEYLTGDLAHFSIKDQTMSSGKLTSDPDKDREAMQIRLVMDM